MSTVQPSDVIPVVVDLPSLSVNFPPAFQAEVPRTNIVSTLTNLVVESVYAAIIEGPEGIGETTVLSQFARRHSSNAISIFITSASRLSFDPELIKTDISVQVHWILTGEVLDRKDMSQRS